MNFAVPSSSVTTAGSTTGHLSCSPSTAWSAQGHSIYCYFDNDEAAYAARNALRLQAMLRPEAMSR